MNAIAVLVLLDAFRPDYLHRTDFLRGLARRGGVGAMEEPFGFVPRAAYFGGLTPNDVGYANIFVREPWRSPFPAVPDMSRLLAALPPDVVRTRLVDEARARTPDFAARYVDAFAVPVGDLPAYGIGETQPPWGPRCGYRSLFHILDEARLEWAQCAWPYTRTIAAADAGIVATFLERVTPATRFGFVHLSTLDAVGHEHGPGSPEMQSALDELDTQCAALHAALHERFDRVQILFFGDHGMVTVVRQVDIREQLREAGFEEGRQFAMFVDSPMARFWFTDGPTREAVADALRRLDCGSLLGPDDLRRYDADRMAPGNGHLYFCAHPGVIFVPNGFQRHASVVRGMHGYLPDIPDNRGLLLSYDSADRTTGTLGVVPATRLFPTCLRMCGLTPSEYTTLEPLQVQPASPQWTAAACAEHERRVSADLARVQAVLGSRAPASALVVTGSFGRGEGGVVDTPAGPQVLNDYDIAVIGADASAAAGEGAALAAMLGIDFCDVMPFPSVAALPVSQLHVDLRYGSRVIAGDLRAVERLPRHAPGSIPLEDAALLLLNRAAGVMLVSLPEQRGATGALSQFAVNQVSKAYMAVGDACLIAIGDYTTRYRDRAARFAALAAALEVEPSLSARVTKAYQYKLAPVCAPGPFGPEDFGVVRPAMEDAFRLLSRHAGGRAVTWADAIGAALAPVQDADSDEQRSRARLQHCGFSPPAGIATKVFASRRAILEGLVTLFRTTPGVPPADAWDTVSASLDHIGAPISTTGAPDADTARQHLAIAWLTVCH